ncbi:MAG: DUF1206 domain-containing protein [Nanoarchaeota archaeon]
MAKTLKKITKAISKSSKKKSKALKDKPHSEKKSHAVKFSESVKGLIYLILALSLFVALFMSNQGYIITREDIIGLLFRSIIGKLILIVIGLSFLIYGLKHLNLVK